MSVPGASRLSGVLISPSSIPSFRKGSEESGSQMPEREHVIHYTVDSEPQTTDQQELTPRQILVNATDDSTKVYLIEVRGKDQVSFKDKLDVEIHMHDGMIFITAALGGGGVSRGNLRQWRKRTF